MVILDSRIVGFCMWVVFELRIFCFGAKTIVNKLAKLGKYEMIHIY
jgi:hypothetical protein